MKIIQFPNTKKNRKENEIKNDKEIKRVENIKITFKNNYAISPTEYWEQYYFLYIDSKKQFCKFIFKQFEDKNMLYDSYICNEYDSIGFKILYYSFVNDVYDYAKTNYISTSICFESIKDYFCILRYSILLKYKENYFSFQSFYNEGEMTTISKLIYKEDIDNIKDLEYVDFDLFIKNEKSKQFHNNIENKLKEILFNYKSEYHIDNKTFYENLKLIIK